MINYNKPVMQLVWDQINRDNPQLKKPLNATNVALLQGPLTNALRDGRNSRIVVNGLPGGGYSGKMDIYYDRLNLASYFSGIYVPVRVPYNATLYRHIVKQISEACGLQITVDDLANPDSQFGDMTVLSGTRTVSIVGTNPAFTGWIPISFTRDDPALAEVFPITGTDVWELPDVYSTVFRLDWTPYITQLINLPMGTPLKIGSNSYVPQFLQALRNWSGIPFVLGSTVTNSLYDITGYTAYRYNSPAMEPDMNGNYSICIKLMPPATAMGRLRRPFYFHITRKDGVKTLTQPADLQRWMKVANIPMPDPTNVSWSKGGSWTGMIPVEGIGTMYGSSYVTRFSNTSHLSRVVQHAFPTESLWREAIAAKTPVAIFALAANDVGWFDFPAVTRNGYTSVSLNNAYTVYATIFVYYDAAQGGYMSYNPLNNTAPAVWYPPTI